MTKWAWPLTIMVIAFLIFALAYNWFFPPPGTVSTGNPQNLPPSQGGGGPEPNGFLNPAVDLLNNMFG